MTGLDASSVAALLHEFGQRSQIPAGVLDMLTIPGVRPDKVIILLRHLRTPRGKAAFRRLRALAQHSRTKSCTGLRCAVSLTANVICTARSPASAELPRILKARPPIMRSVGEMQRKHQCGGLTRLAHIVDRLGEMSDSRLSASNEETLATIGCCSSGPLAVLSSSRGTVPYLQHSGLPAARGRTRHRS